MQEAISDNDFEEAIRELSDLPEIEDCWSLLIAESGKNRIDTLAQLLILTSIVEREFSHMCAVRQGHGRRVTRSEDANARQHLSGPAVQHQARASTFKR
jgi:hypothetical protein